MAEYSTHYTHDFRNTRVRTADWVSATSDTEFYSPSMPGAPLGDDEGGYSEPSDAESSHSVPPRLMLRYGDGRPDIPIPHVYDRDAFNSVSRSQTYPQGSLHRSGTSVHGHGRSSRHEMIPSVPEEIQVLPSLTTSGTRNGQHHIRSKSLPRNAFNNEPNVPPFSHPPPKIVSRPLHSAGSGPQTIHPIPSGAESNQQIAFSQSHSGHWPANGSGHHTRSHHQHPQSSSVYASHSRQQYRSPAAYSYAPKVGPNGVMYSHSAPVPGTHYPAFGTYTPMTAPTSHSTGGRGRSRSRTRSVGGKYETSSSADTASTYYVIPSGHHVIRTPEMTEHTSSSTSKSPTTPISTSSFHKRPFFHRLFHFAEKFSSAGSTKGSSRGERRVRRRHSTERL